MGKNREPQTDSKIVNKYSFDGCPRAIDGVCPRNCPFSGAPSTVVAENDAEAREEFGVRSLNCGVCSTNPTSSFTA